MTSHVAPPPDPKLQECLQEYKFAIYSEQEQIRAAITDFEKSIPSNLPVDKLDIFDEHVEYALDTFTLVKTSKTEKEYNLFAQDYRDLHFSVRKKKK